MGEWGRFAKLQNANGARVKREKGGGEDYKGSAKKGRLKLKLFVKMYGGQKGGGGSKEREKKSDEKIQDVERKGST